RGAGGDRRAVTLGDTRTLHAPRRRLRRVPGRRFDSVSASSQRGHVGHVGHTARVRVVDHAGQIGASVSYPRAAPAGFPSECSASGLRSVPTSWSAPLGSARSTICWLSRSWSRLRQERSKVSAKRSYWANRCVRCGTRRWYSVTHFATVAQNVRSSSVPDSSSAAPRNRRYESTTSVRMDSVLTFSGTSARIRSTSGGNGVVLFSTAVSSATSL